MSQPSIPGYWMHETSGVLRPVVERYLQGAELSARDVATMRTYLRQWIELGDWKAGGDAIARLRVRVLLLDSRAAIARWLEAADELGIDPL